MGTTRREPKTMTDTGKQTGGAVRSIRILIAIAAACRRTRHLSVPGGRVREREDGLQIRLLRGIVRRQRLDERSVQIARRHRLRAGDGKAVRQRARLAGRDRQVQQERHPRELQRPQQRRRPRLHRPRQTGRRRNLGRHLRQRSDQGQHLPSAGAPFFGYHPNGLPIEPAFNEIKFGEAGKPGIEPRLRAAARPPARTANTGISHTATGSRRSIGATSKHSKRKSPT